LDKRILIVAVNYNSPKETLDFVKSLSSLKNTEILQVVIVENSDKDQRLDELPINCRQHLKDILFVKTPSNCYYFGSVNYGLMKLGLYPRNYDYFIISNADILIEDISFLDKLISLRLVNAGIIAPSVISTAQGVDQNPYMIARIKKAFFYYYYVIRQYVLFTAMHEKLTDYVRERRAAKIRKKFLPGVIYAPHGAFIIFTQSYFESGGSIDFGLNLFGEEIFVAEECRKHSLNVYYQPQISVLHAEHVSTGAVSSKFVVEKKKQSVIYFLKNFK
jgi:GT2 family glycosyltransferase